MQVPSGRKELWIAGRQASRRGWVRVSDGSERVFYRSVDGSKITLERPPDFGVDEPTWADGTELFIYRGYCSRCNEYIPRSEAGPVAFSADQAQGIAVVYRGNAMSNVNHVPSMGKMQAHARLEEGNRLSADHARLEAVGPRRLGRGGGSDDSRPCSSIKYEKCRSDKKGPRPTEVVKIFKSVDLTGAGDLLARARVARSIPKCMFSRLSEQTVRASRFDEQLEDCVKAKTAAVIAGEERRRTARATKMKLRCISEHGSKGAGDYLCWFSSDGRLDYFGETKNGKAHGWGLAEYQDGSWCLSNFQQGQQHTLEGGKISTMQYASGIRYEGEMKKGRPHGRGRKIWPDETLYTGDFVMGKEHGEGTINNPDGSELKGKYRAGIRHGPGVFIDARGQKTVGNFRDDLFGKAEESGIIPPATADITIQSGHHNPASLLHLAIETLVTVTHAKPLLNKASVLMAKMPLHLHHVVAAAFASRARDLSPGFRAALPSFAWRSVQEVRMCHVALKPHDTSKLSYFMEAILVLRKLSLIGCKLSGEAVAPVAEAMATSPTLEDVDLSWNPIGRHGVPAVVAALESSPKLRNLSLAGCQLGEEGGQIVITAIGSDRDKFRLLELNLDHNTLGANAGCALAVALSRNLTLTRLSLRANNLGPQGGAELAAGLSRNRGGLKDVVVTDNGFGPAVATLVAASMSGRTSQCLRGFGHRSSTERDRCTGFVPSKSVQGIDGAVPGIQFGVNEQDVRLASSAEDIKQEDSVQHRAREVAIEGNGFGVDSQSPQDTAATTRVPPAVAKGTRSSSLRPSRGSAVDEVNKTRRCRGVSVGNPSFTDSHSQLVIPAAVLEEALGRPQTAGTASG